MNIVVRTSEGAVSLLVDEIGDVLHMDESDYETAAGESRCRGAGPHSRRLQTEGPIAPCT